VVSCTYFKTLFNLSRKPFRKPLSSIELCYLFKIPVSAKHVKEALEGIHLVLELLEGTVANDMLSTTLIF
jgi:hypothetical protein